MLQSETVKKYDTYKDSGIEWIGEIPQEWNLTRLKQHYQFEKGKNAALYTNEYIGLNEGEYPVYSGQTENNGIMGNVNTFDYDESICVFTTTVGAKVMSPKILSGKFCLSQNCLIMKKIGTVDEKFLYYQLLPLFDYEKSLIPSYMQPSLRISDLKRYVIISCEEQQRIAEYLDKKCGEIDRVVETEKSVIEKLKEYKQSIITEAVTKGLDKSVPLKDNGIEWIGKIPQHWNITQISKLYEVILGKMLCTNPSTDTDTLENYLCSANIKFDGVKTDEIKQMYFNKNEKEMYLLKENDIVISEGGDAGTASIYKGEVQPCYIQNAVHKVCTFDINKMLNKFLYYWIFLCKKCGYIDLICNKATIMHYTKEKVSKTPIVFLPIEEQQQIIDYLDKKCSEIDKAIADKEKVIEKFSEFKKSLIYECITGKRKVVA